ncbi:hypothetical protein BCR33DRAFT_713245 [Rhizoclosmatium globosum]|uniref:DDHD domain-containing protein n=1 Tax=Rhizoclosmatium globosum TaxID=329046 RepID=A0A1Y2CU07_9FUNG|nr:hypothetical protein BCR33DRAFT_713245 [Rhizoclosmatium globosum]|eukprot:ORY50447.1 hypothetical protein BCR33DRAFT_713245 [Rhizoclosmatium globosum]
MALVTLPTTPIFRQINNDMLADVLYFFSSFHGAKILELVAGVINDQYRKFMLENPEFIGPICILAHSLGGIITYDLLANQDIATDIPPTNQPKGKTPLKLSTDSRPAPFCRTHFEITYPKLCFKPSMLVTLGSQVAAVMIMRGQSPNEYKLPPGILYRNVFHLYDPLAYRIEPLHDARYAEISPILIQRPSSVSKGFSMAYYHSLAQLFSSYLPSLPTDLPNLQSMLPAVAAMSFPQIGIPDLGFAGSGFPELMAMPKSFSDARKAMLESMYNLTSWGLFNDGVHGTKRTHDRDVDEIGDVDHKEQGEGDIEDDEPKHKKRRVQRESGEGTSSDAGDLTTGKYGRKIAKPRTSTKSTKQPEPSEPTKPQPKSPTFGPTSPTVIADGVMETIRNSVRRMSNMFSLFEEDGSELPLEQDESSKLAENMKTLSPQKRPPPEPLHRRASQQDVEEVLTEELAASAERILKRDPSPEKEVPTEKTNEKPLPLKERLDYFVTETVMENTVHQYLIGMKAHFSYWNNKDMMFHIVSTLLALRKDDGNIKRDSQ